MTSYRYNYIKNKYDAEFFKVRFKRNPRIWTLEDVHALWLRALERGSKQQKVVSDCMDRITKELPSVNNKISAYYYDDCDKLSVYEFGNNHSFPHWGYTSNHYKRSENKAIARAEETYRLLNPQSLEYGQQFFEAKRHRSNKEYIVKNIMFDMIKEKLSEKYEKIAAYIDKDIVIIDIAGYKYSILVEGKNYGYCEFTFMGTFVNKPIKLK